jgi:hypothetical protein
MKQTTQKLITSKTMRITTVFLLIISLFMFTGCSTDDSELEIETLNKSSVSKKSNDTKNSGTVTLSSKEDILVGQFILKIRHDADYSHVDINSPMGSYVVNYLHDFRDTFIDFMDEVTEYPGIYDNATLTLVNVNGDTGLDLGTEYWLFDFIGTVRGLTNDDTIHNIESVSHDCGGLNAIICFFANDNNNKGNGLGDDIPKNPSITLQFIYPN